MGRTFKIPSLVAICLLALGACGSDKISVDSAGAGQSDFPMTIQSCGREVTFEKTPQRVLTVGAVPPLLIAAAGAAGKIVAGTNNTQPFPGEYQAALKDVPMISPNEAPSMEIVVGQQPELVIGFEGSTPNADDLEAAGIKFLGNTYCPGSSGTYEEIFADINLYGRVLGTGNEAAREVGKLRTRVAAVEKQVKNAPDGRRAATFALNRGAIKPYGKPSTAHQQMEALGLTNVFADVEKRNFEVNIEEVIRRDPEVVILSYLANQTPESIKKDLLAQPGVQKIAAIRNNDIVAVPFGFIGPTPVAVEGLEVLAKMVTATK